MSTVEPFEPQDEDVAKDPAMKPFSPSDDDVLRGVKFQDEVITFRALKGALRNKLQARQDGGIDPINSSLMGDGYLCELLSSVIGGGWRKGKLKINIEFIPDNLNQPKTIPPQRRK